MDDSLHGNGEEFGSELVSLGAERRRRRQADRLETLWRIANDISLHGTDSLTAMLLEAAASIRHDQEFCGILARVDGPEMVALAVTPAPHAQHRRETLRVGARVTFANTIAASITSSRFWDDVSLEAHIPEIARRFSWRAVITTWFTVGEERYHLTFASTEPAIVPFGNHDIAFVETLTGTFNSYFKVEALQRSLRDAEERSRHHADRLESLWRIANDPQLRDGELWRAMLREAAAAIRPESRFRAWFGRVTGNEALVESVVTIIPTRQGPDRPDPVVVGDVLQLENTIVGRMLDEGVELRSFDDLRDTEFESPGSRERGWRALIVTTFSAGGAMYILLFVSAEPANPPFDAHDQAYIRILASFFGRHVHERWNFDRLSYQQSHDNLTGLFSRSHFRSLARAAAATLPSYALVIIDATAFREVNDAYGTMIGDALLVEIGAALQRRAASDEIVGRIGGDVFCVFVPQPASQLAARTRARYFGQSFAEPFSTGDREGREFIALEACIGVAQSPEDGRALDDVLGRANAALSASKDRGPGTVVSYVAGMEGASQRRAQLRNEVLAALEGEQFELYYQPHVDLQTNAVTGCEALIRWNHPGRGVLLPAQFIPFAEQTGMIAAIDRWVMKASFKAAADLKVLRPDFRLYFNLSGRQAGDASIVSAFVRAARAGVPIANVGVEITETDAMRDVDATRRVCRGLRRLGVFVAIDDFGTGYSSLSSLTRLPVDVVKIDRSFIAGVLDDPHDETIAETIMNICERYGFTALAEGVERQAEIDWLRRRSCKTAQGYAYSPALPLDSFKAWYAAHR